MIFYLSFTNQVTKTKQAASGVISTLAALTCQPFAEVNMAAANSTAPILTTKQIIRFWSKVAVGSPDKCWPCILSTNNHGYAYIRIGHKKMRAHILARFIATGEWPGNLETLHNCPDGDNPCCCNPAHLWIGTHAENMRDMVAKGRNRKNQVKGERQGQSKLTAEKVIEIRALYATGRFTLEQLGRQFGVRLTTIHHIIKRVNWKHVP